MTLDGDRRVEAATAWLGIDLKALVAGCSVWAHPDMAGLSDHDEGVAPALRFRSWELFGWKPEEADVPTSPQGYPPPEAWLSPPLPTDRALKALARLDADRIMSA